MTSGQEGDLTAGNSCDSQVSTFTRDDLGRAGAAALTGLGDVANATVIDADARPVGIAAGRIDDPHVLDQKVQCGCQHRTPACRAARRK